jgi:hypothetical protein
MAQKTIAGKIISFGTVVLVAAGFHASVDAHERLIFNQNPAAIEQYFGPYWSRLTTTTGSGDHRVTYAYNPGAIRSLFPNAEGLRISVEFINHQAKRIKIHQNGTGFDIPSGQLRESDYYPVVFDALFEDIFGYHPPANFQLHGRSIYDDSGDGGTLHTTTYCIAEGIAISYEWISVRSFVNYIDILQEPTCTESTFEP